MSTARIPLGFRLVRAASGAAVVAAMVAWLVYWIVISSWIGHRPTAPAPPFVLPYNDHGLIYVSAADIRLSHALLAVVAALALAFLATWLLQRAWPQGRAEARERAAKARQSWLKGYQRRYWARRQRQR